jgi:hypothetical protein
MNVNSSSRLALVFASAIFGASVVSAQTFVGGVRGLVQDPSSQVIASATVTLTNAATGVSRSTMTNALGEYVFSQVNPATYTIAAEATGFKRIERTGVVIGTQEFLNVDLKMELGQITESVQVTSEVPLIDSATASNGQVLDSQRITDLPNLGRNPFLLSKLSTNVVPVGDPRYNRFQDQSGSSLISVNGGPIRGNNYLIDGIPVTDSTNRAVIIPATEATYEMKLQMTTYDASMGTTGGGVFNTLLKSGSNDLHGSILGYLRETDWTANNFFANASGQPRPTVDFKTWATSASGPVVIPKLYNGKNRTFFFVANEAYRQHSQYTDRYSVPSPLERVGNYSQSSVTIYDPFSSRPCTAADNCPSGVSVVRNPLGENIIPSKYINAVGAAIMNYYPQPQIAGKTDSFNYTGTDSLFDRADQYVYKADHSVTDWFRLSGSFMYYKSREPGGNTLGTPAGGSSQNPYLLYRRVDATAVNATVTPNPTTVVAVRYGFNRFPNLFLPVSSGFNPAQLGFPASYAGQIEALYFPKISVLNGPSISGQSPTNSVYWSKNALFSVSKYIGRHSISVGMDYRLIHTDFLSLTDAAGNFSFNGVFSRQYPQQSNGTGADFADLLMGYPSSGQVQTAIKLFYFTRGYAGYLQDDIRVNSRLTVNAGLRYEYATGLTENNDHLVVGFDRSTLNPIAANVTGVLPLGAIQYAGVSGNPTSCCKPPKTKFGPRLGVAFQVNSKTTLRAGYGIFWAPGFFTNSAAIAPGFSRITTYVASNDNNATPANSLSNPFPEGIQQPVGNSLGALTSIGSTFNYPDQNSTAGIVHQFSADVQRELPYNIALEVGYIGSRSNHLIPTWTSTGNSVPGLAINQVPTNYLSLGSALNDSVDNPFYLHGGSGVIGSAKVARAQLLKPFPEYSTIQALTNPSSAQYDSMVVKIQKRFSQGLTFLSTITWSKNEDNEFGSAPSNAMNLFSNPSNNPPTQPQNVYDLGSEWALAAVDTPLRFTGTWSYNLPFGRGKKFLNGSRVLDYAIGGWQVNGTVIARKGFPLFIYQLNNNSVLGTAAQRPNATGISPAMPGSSPEDRMSGYVNPAAFAPAAAFTFGNVSRSIDYRGPGEANWDASVFKNFQFRERYNAQFRAEALNLFNTPLFANPNTQFIPNNAAFGKLTYQANFARQLQLGLRFFF